MRSVMHARRTSYNGESSTSSIDIGRRGAVAGLSLQYSLAAGKAAMDVPFDLGYSGFTGMLAPMVIAMVMAMVMIMTDHDEGSLLHSGYGTTLILLP